MLKRASRLHTFFDAFSCITFWFSANFCLSWLWFTNNSFFYFRVQVWSGSVIIYNKVKMGEICVNLTSMASNKSIYHCSLFLHLIKLITYAFQCKGCVNFPRGASCISPAILTLIIKRAFNLIAVFIDYSS